MMRCRPGTVTHTAFATVPDQRRTAPLSLALRRIRDTKCAYLLLVSLLIPKLASGSAARVCELRTRDTGPAFGYDRWQYRLDVATEGGLPMDAVTPQTRKSADQHSHVVRPANMEWQKTRFAGCEVKTLLFDPATGLVTALMRFEPGAILPDHEHVKIEQTYVLEGTLVDKEGPAAGLEVKPGEFVWREEGSRHVAWTPEGGLMLAMFQIPNKFHERDGRVTDLGGQDWESVWGHALKD
jgi:quercetin dioxygenase-like cupin family protein